MKMAAGAGWHCRSDLLNEHRVTTDTTRKQSPHQSARPFLKWAGGKQQLLSQYEPHFPAGFDRYWEPFVGSGAVFFHLWNMGRIEGKALLSDNNGELVNAYRVVRDEVEDLIELLSVHKERHCREYYYQIRLLDRQDVVLSDLERAARTIYLNRTCYNGLYRVNSKGQFNVPMGRYRNPSIVRADVLRAASAALQGVKVEVRDFRTLVELAQEGDFAYFDPPYHPISETANFTSYTAGSFHEQDQRDLAAVFGRLSAKGCRCMLSNSHTPWILELYRDYRMEVVQAARAINADAAGRGKINEVLVLNYEGRK
jgi:DNA adenine methylase